MIPILCSFMQHKLFLKGNSSVFERPCNGAALPMKSRCSLYTLQNDAVVLSRIVLAQ